MDKKVLFDAVRTLDPKKLTIDEMVHLIDLFHLKEKQMEQAISDRKSLGEN